MIFELKQVKKDHHSASFSAYRKGHHIGKFDLTGKFGSRDMHVAGIFADKGIYLGTSDNVNTEHNIRPYTILDGKKPIGMISQIVDAGFITNNFIYNEIELENKTYSQYSIAIGPGNVKFTIYENKKQIALIEKDNTEKGLNFKIYAKDKDASVLSIICILYIYITSIYKPVQKPKKANILFSSPFDKVLANAFDNNFKNTIDE